VAQADWLIAELHSPNEPSELSPVMCPRGHGLDLEAPQRQGKVALILALITKSWPWSQVLGFGLGLEIKSLAST